MLGGGGRRGGKHEQDAENGAHVRVNERDAISERRVQNRRFCVNQCMENVDNVDKLDKPEPAGQPAEQNADPKKKRDKVRSAWISFAGRIAAQLVGAIATVALGVMVLHRYTSGDARPGHPNAAAALGAPPSATEQRQDAYARPAASAPAQPSVHIIVLTPAMLGLGNAGEPLVAPGRACSPQLDTPSTTAAHLDNGTFLSR